MTVSTQLATLVVQQAEAPEAAPGPLAGLTSALPFVLMFGVIYFLMLRPASKQRKEHEELLNTLKKDDEVMTSGGMYGRIASLDDKIATLEIADKVKIRILRDRISGRWNAGSTPSSSPIASAQK